ncbi:MAG: peptidoglycan-binding protein, partial [Methylocystis sp.]
PPRDARRKGRRSFLARMFGENRIGVTLILGIAAVAAIGVPMNALFLQEGRHPAPLFPVHSSKNAVMVAPRPPARPAAIEAARTEREAGAQPRPAPRDLIASKLDNLGSKTLETRKTEPAKTDLTRTAAKTRDAIGQLILSRAPPAAGADKAAKAPSPEKADRAPSAEKADRPTSPEKTASVDRRVLYAQRALLRLGYVVRADGVLNAATRRTLEKFERDAGLPAKGKITPLLLKQLAKLSGLPHP